MFLYDLSFTEVLRQMATAIIFLWASKKVVGYDKLKGLGIITPRLPGSVLLIMCVIWCKVSWIFTRIWKRQCCALSGNKWQLERLGSESKPEVLHYIHFTKLKVAATMFFVDGQWPQSPKTVQNNKKSAQVYSAENKMTIIYSCPNLGLGRNSSKNWLAKPVTPSFSLQELRLSQSPCSFILFSSPVSFRNSLRR